MMARRPPPSRRFAKPVVMADGTRLASPAAAMRFLNALPRERVTAPLYYAAALVNDAALADPGAAGDRVDVKEKANSAWGMGNGEWGMGNGQSRLANSLFPTPHSPFPIRLLLAHISPRIEVLIR